MIPWLQNWHNGRWVAARVHIEIRNDDDYVEVMTWLRGIYFASEPAGVVDRKCLIMEYKFFREEDATAFKLRFGGMIANMGNR